MKTHKIDVSRGDVIWSYVAQFFSASAGLITLPVILTVLSAEEIGLYYIMLAISSMISLFDFGFSPQIGRTLTYVLSGSQTLSKNGLDSSEGKTINAKLFSTLLKTSKKIYLILGFFSLIGMLSLGTLYVYKITDSFTTINNVFFIWIVFSFSAFINVFVSLYSALLTGMGMIKENKLALIISKLLNIFLTITLLYANLGLFAISIAAITSPILRGILSHKYFFKSDVKKLLEIYNPTKKDKSEMFSLIWYNAKKLGLVYLGTFVLTKLSLFIAGFYLELKIIASYGLLLQIGAFVSSMSTTLFYSYGPKFASDWVKDNRIELYRKLSFSVAFFYLVYTLLSIFIIGFAPQLLEVIKSNAELPELFVVILFFLIVFLESNHSLFASFIVTKNSVPFVKPALLAGVMMTVGGFCILQFSTLGILGLVIVQGISQAIYNNWKWPLVVLTDFRTNLVRLLIDGIVEIFDRFRHIWFEVFLKDK